MKKGAIKHTLSGGTAHTLPVDMRNALSLRHGTCMAWESLTPLARNEWICWITFVKQEKTRKEHIERAIGDLNKGKRRPCCWMGCPHRKDKPMNASQKYMLKKKSS